MKRALLIAEKPDLMRHVQAVYRQMKHYDLEIDFKSFIGHTMTLFAPADYQSEWEKWDLTTLPMIPRQFRYKPIPDKVKLYQDLKTTIEKGNYDLLINCCDPGREGQHIFHNFYQTIGCKLPVKRMWHSDLTEGELERALRNLRDDLTEPSLVSMTQASMLRAYFDWLIGMNFSRAFTMVGNRNVSIGRVMTPILKIVVDRELELVSFKPQDFWELEANFGDYKGVYFDSENENETRLFNKEQALWLESQIQGQMGIIEKVDKKREIKYAPRLHSLADIQNEANKTYGYTMSETLDIVQSLYESKFLSYPRTDCSYLTSSVAQDFQSMLTVLTVIPSVSKHVTSIASNMELLQQTMKNKKYVNDAKVTDHYAIVPTGVSFNFATLTSKQQHIMELIAKRLVSIFLPPIIVNKSTVITNVNQYRFKTNGSVLEDKGFSVLYGTKFNDQLLPNLSPHEKRSVISTELLSKQTTPPNRYTDETLNLSMENAGKFVEEEELKEVLKVSKGIGTPATRGNIVEKLVEKKMIERRKKSFYATDYGISIIRNLAQHPVSSPSLTGIWEEKLMKIEACELEPNVYYQEMIHYIQKATADFKQMNIEMTPDQRYEPKLLGNCPVCGAPVVVGKDYYLCQHYKKGDTPCDFILPKLYGGAKISETDVKLLLNLKPTKPKKIKFKDGRETTVPLCYSLSEKRLTFFKPKSKEIGRCPQCGGRVLEGNFYLCEHYKKSCTFILGKTAWEAPISVEDVELLLKGLHTPTKCAMFKGRPTNVTFYLNQEFKIRPKFY